MRSATALDDERVRDAASAPPPRRPTRRRAHRERLRRDGSTRRASPSRFRVRGIKSEETPRTHLFKSLSRPRDGRSSKHTPDNERARDGQPRSRCCAPEKDDNLAVPRSDARRRGARGRHGRRAAYHALEVACADTAALEERTTDAGRLGRGAPSTANDAVVSCTAAHAMFSACASPWPTVRCRGTRPLAPRTPLGS